MPELSFNDGTVEDAVDIAFATGSNASLSAVLSFLATYGETTRETWPGETYGVMALAAFVRGPEPNAAFTLQLSHGPAGKMQ